jgi:hypothetical protein
MMQHMLRHELPWLVLVHQLPARPSSLRVRVWRRLQAIGAVPLRGAAYVLPNRSEPREDLAWIAGEVRALGGQASLLAAASLDDGGDAALVRDFQAARAGGYRSLAERVERAVSPRGRRVSARGADLAERRKLLAEWESLERITYFDVPEQEEARRMIERLRSRPAPAEGGARARAPLSSFRSKTWVTRPRPGIDRMSSAWLIRTHIDPKARFAFRKDVPTGSEVPFDMYAGEFSHKGGACTLEVLVRRFAIQDPAVEWLCRVVHDVDLRDDRYGEPEAAGVAALVEGLRARHSDDRRLLEEGISLIAALVAARSAGTRTSAARSKPAGRSKASSRIRAF